MTASKLLWRIAPIFLPLALVGLYGVFSVQSNSFFFPTWDQVLGSFRDNWMFERVASDVLPSLTRMFTGFALASMAGVAAGLLLGSNAILSTAADPVIQFMRSLPSPALIPLALLVAGTGDASKIIVIVLGATWPILLNTMDGVRSVNRTQIDMARSYQIPRSAQILNVVLPSAMPRILAGMKTGLALAVILMVVTEMVASSNGIGYFVSQAQRQFSIPEMWSGVLLLGILGYSLNLVFTKIEKRVLHWYNGMLGRVAR
jgi:ABC-type nitrate/sulfonate/bicarbonate transport system permease component